MPNINMMKKVNMMGDNAKECSLCLEVLEVDNFFPCVCNYKVCRFCLHTLRTDGHGLCPHCRKVYPKNAASFTPLSEDEIVALKAKHSYRDQQCLENQKYLADLRVVQKNLVFAIGLPESLADADTLKRYEYFGQYGKILKIIINNNSPYLGEFEYSPSAYITYIHDDDALRAIHAVNNTQVEDKLIKTSIGTNKYCKQFIKNLPCPYHDCIYIHDFDPEASFTKEEIIDGKHQEYEKKLLDTLIQKYAEGSVRSEMPLFLPLINSSEELQTQYSSYQIEHFYYSDETHAILQNFHALQQSENYLSEINSDQSGMEIHELLDYNLYESTGISNSISRVDQSDTEIHELLDDNLYESTGILNSVSRVDQSDVELHELLDDNLYESTGILNSISRVDIPFPTSHDDLDFESFEEVRKSLLSIDNEINLQQISNRKYKKYRDNISPKIFLPSSSISNNTSSIKWDTIIDQLQILYYVPHLSPQQYIENINMIFDLAKFNSTMARTFETFDHSSIGIYDTNYINQSSVYTNGNMSQHAAYPMDYFHIPCLTNAQLEHYGNNHIYSHNAQVVTSQHSKMISYTGLYNTVHGPIDVPMPMPMSMSMPIQNGWHPFQNIPTDNGSKLKLWHY